MIKYKTGSIEYYYNTEQKAGTVTAGGTPFISNNALELLNVFINEIDSKLRHSIQDKLETAGINKYTGCFGK